MKTISDPDDLVAALYDLGRGEYVFAIVGLFERVAHRVVGKSFKTTPMKDRVKITCTHEEEIE